MTPAALRWSVDTIVVQTTVYADAETVYDFLLDFPGYASYSKYLTDVRTRTGDGGVGTRYALRFAWWKLSYTAHSEVVGSADAGVLNLPALVSIGWVVEKAIPLIRSEAERVIQRAVADIEGRSREITLEITTDSAYL